MALDVSGLAYFMPIFGFLFVFTITYALLAKIKVLGSSEFANMLISFIISTTFITIASAKLYIANILPWFVVLAASLLFVLVFVGFSQRNIENILGKRIETVLITLVMIVFFLSGVAVFSSMLMPFIKTIANQEMIIGAMLVCFTGIITSWILATNR